MIKKYTFTLVELLTVIVVIMIISAMILPTLLSQTDAQLINAGNRNLRMALITARSYAIENQSRTLLYISSYQGKTGIMTGMQIYYKEDSEGHSSTTADTGYAASFGLSQGLPDAIPVGRRYDLPETVLLLLDTTSELYRTDVDSQAAVVINNHNIFVHSDYVEDDGFGKNGLMLEYYPNGTLSALTTPQDSLWATVKTVIEGEQDSDSYYGGLKINKLTNVIKAKTITDGEDLEDL